MQPRAARARVVRLDVLGTWAVSIPTISLRLFCQYRVLVCESIGVRTSYFALRRPVFRPIERVMGQQHRVRVKRRRRVAYLDRKKVAAKAAPIRREAPKTKAKPKKQAAPTPET